MMGGAVCWRSEECNPASVQRGQWRAAAGEARSGSLGVLTQGWIALGLPQTVIPHRPWGGGSGKDGIGAFGLSQRVRGRSGTRPAPRRGPCPAGSAQRYCQTLHRVSHTQGQIHSAERVDLLSSAHGCQREEENLTCSGTAAHLLPL
ncbi:hypothetical protein AAFF_G00347690 [Aldrovandia affinis]|uniref:Uncharacterized protein n=1 Tax=Aldrovandia affinis TaxID=143900 RepID=A0AAD7WNT4_9TELE|nr:hypothetical protein AAFF_G00347690 [Aldrovandia affinis]